MKKVFHFGNKLLSTCELYVLLTKQTKYIPTTDIYPYFYPKKRQNKLYK